MPKYFREVSKRFSGNTELASKYMGVARQLLGGLKEMSGDLFQNTRSVLLPDGTKIRVSFAGALGKVFIDVRGAFAEYATKILAGVFVRPAWVSGLDWEVATDVCPHTVTSVKPQLYSARDWVSSDGKIVSLVGSGDYDRYFSDAGVYEVGVDGTSFGSKLGVVGAAIFNGDLVLVLKRVVVGGFEFVVDIGGVELYSTGLVAKSNDKWSGVGQQVQKSVVFNTSGNEACTAISSHEVLLLTLSLVDGVTVCAHTIAHVDGSHGATVGLSNVTTTVGMVTDTIYTEDAANYLMACDYAGDTIRYLFCTTGYYGHTHVERATRVVDGETFTYIQFNSIKVTDPGLSFAVVEGTTVLATYVAPSGGGGFLQQTKQIPAIPPAASYGSNVSYNYLTSIEGYNEGVGCKLLAVDIRSAMFLVRETLYAYLVNDAGGTFIDYPDNTVVIDGYALAQGIFGRSIIKLITPVGGYDVSDPYREFNTPDLSKSSAIDVTASVSPFTASSGLTPTPTALFSNVVEESGYPFNHIMHTTLADMCFTHVTNSSSFPSDYAVKAFSICSGSVVDVTPAFEVLDGLGSKVHPLAGECITQHFGATSAA